MLLCRVLDRTLLGRRSFVWTGVWRGSVRMGMWLLMEVRDKTREEGARWAE